MGGSSSYVTGYKYYGSFAVAVGLGPATRLTRVTNAETEIWAGDLDQTSRDGDGKTTLTTTLGTLYWYWGRPDQLPDPVLQAALIDFGAGETAMLVPAWPGLIYVVADDIYFGSSPTPPTLKFEFERQLSALTLSSHTLDTDALVPEVIHNLLTETLALAGLASTQVPPESFAAAAETVLAEGLAASPYLDDDSEVREFIGDLLTYIDGYLYYESGQIKLGLLRHASSSSLLEIDESLLAAEPQPKNVGWGDTWNFTRATFTDRANEWEDGAVEPFDDPANYQITGERVDEEVRLPYVTSRAAAKILVKRKGIKGGLPSLEWELEVLPSLRTLKPGDRVKLTYAKLGLSQRVVRVLEVGRDAGKNQTVKLTVEEERTRDESHDYVIPDDDFRASPELFALAPTQPRLGVLPPDLLGDADDGFLLAGHRPVGMATGFSVWWTWDPAQSAYTQIATANAFPFYGTLQWWTPARQGESWVLRITFQSATEATRFVSWAQASVELYAVTGQRTWKSVNGNTNRHETSCCWLRIVLGGYLAAVDNTTIEVEAVGAAFGADNLALETWAVAGTSPTQYIYLGRQTDFFVHRTDSLYFAREGGNAPTKRTRTIKGWSKRQLDTDWKRYLKATVFNALEEEAIDDVTAAVFDRNDTTQCPDGTYTVSWGARVALLAETYDLSGAAIVIAGQTVNAITTLDVVLFACVVNLAEDDQFLLADSTDTILGYMLLTRQRCYNQL